MKRILLLFLGMTVMYFTAGAQKIANLVAASPDHTILNQAIVDGDLTAFFEGGGPITLFAPTDEAFEALPADLLNAMMADPEGVLRDIVLYHTVPGSYTTGALTDGQQITTVFDNQTVTITVDAGDYWVNGAMITTSNVNATNGTIQVVDAVLMPQTTTIYDFIAESADHTTLTAALDASGLNATLDGEGAYTTFAPTDAAFEALPAGLVDALLTQPEGLLTDLLLHHVLDTVLLSTELSDGDMLQTLFGDELAVSIVGSDVVIDGAMVTVADQVTSNGVVHVVDAVLIPDSATVYDMVANSEDHMTLESAIDAAELDVTLQSSGTFTVFAPTDAAFDALPQGALDILLADPSGALTDVLLNHVADTIVLSSGMDDGSTLTSLQGGELVVANDGSTITINGAEVTVADILATNGVVHVIDMVLVPEGVFCTEYAEGPYTNFNSTFGGAPVATNGICPVNQFTTFEAWASESYTVDNFVAGTTYTFSICEGPGAGSWEPELSVYDPSGALVAIAQDCEITWTPMLSGTYEIGIQEVGYCGAESPNLGTDNGYPTLTCQSANTVYTTVGLSPDHEILDSAIVAAGLVGTLNGEGPFTLFAPTDLAFDALPEGLLSAMLTDPTGLLTDLLTYHVVGDNLPSSLLNDGDMLTTLNGEQVEISIDGDDIFVNGALITVADVTTDNGVVHIIDAVLVPSDATTIYDVVAGSSDHETLETVIDAAGLEGELSGDNLYTLFAPTDAAFAAWEEGVLDSLLASPIDTLVKFLEYHLVSGIQLSSDLSAGPVATVEGSDVMISIDGSDVMVNDATVTVADIPAINGVVHVIDVVLTYPGFSVDVGDISALSQLRIYPNPASDFVRMDFTLIQSTDLTIDVVNAMGQTVRSYDYGRKGSGVYREKMDFSGLSDGFYLLHIQADQGQVTQKVQILR